jgi:hypothetical protein
MLKIKQQQEAEEVAELSKSQPVVQQEVPSALPVAVQKVEPAKQMSQVDKEA